MGTTWLNHRNRPCPRCGRHPIWGHTLEETRACRSRPHKRKPKPKKGPVFLVREKGPAEIRSLGDARHAIGATKGGLEIQARGLAHHWTPEEARAAALKMHKRRHLKSGRLRYQSTHRRPKQPRAPLRAKHASPGIPEPLGIWYRTGDLQWVEHTPAYGIRCISERTALSKLGYIDRWWRRSWEPPTPVGIRPINNLKHTDRYAPFDPEKDNNGQPCDTAQSRPDRTDA